MNCQPGFWRRDASSLLAILKMPVTILNMFWENIFSKQIMEISKIKNTKISRVLHFLPSSIKWIADLLPRHIFLNFTRKIRMDCTIMNEFEQKVTWNYEEVDFSHLRLAASCNRITFSSYRNRLYELIMKFVEICWVLDISLSTSKWIAELLPSHLEKKGTQNYK